MEALQPGHIYKLQNKIKGFQKLIYFKDLPEGDKSNHDGVLCQEVMRSLIDRYLDLFAQKPCYETMEIITRLRECLILGEKRAFGNTLEKSYAKIGKHPEQLPIQSNGHIFGL